MATPAVRNAPPPAQPLPLIVPSHGGLRSAVDSGAWLDAALAEAGGLVVEVNAPRPRDASQATAEIWQGPTDISRTLDSLLGSADWAGRIDPGRIAAGTRRRALITKQPIWIA
ncbi:hypothetical protein ACN2XU_01305 [Primorskyibacter sp. 2E107]|uniref:hypothetical protein n=1 Tax=Primorskyibacter sp. 2E107 TaxID=3403458 RepID=UPI003AF6B935